MHKFCGLDFGTSNSTIGVCVENVCQIVPLEDNKSAMRSAIFCDGEQKEFVFGQQGVNHYLEGIPGRLMMSLKSVLGTALMNDKTIIFGEYVSYAHILSYFIKYLKKMAESKSQTDLTQVVLGRPVHFHDHDPAKDKLAQDTLEILARELGFQDISFQYEPIAAALTYETTIEKEQLALIIDMGGGTSDFSVIRLHPGIQKIDRWDDVLANCGVHIAGTDFDKKLSLNAVMPLLGMGSMISGSSSDLEMPAAYYHELTTWHTLNSLYDAKTIAHVRSIQIMAHDKPLLDRLINVLRKRAGHQILYSVENAKQRLSDVVEASLDLSFVENDLEVMLSQKLLNHYIDDPLQKIIDTVKETIKVAGIDFADINAIFYTGGSTKIPVIREKINALFPQAIVVQGDAFGSVGMGLTLDAQRKYS